MSGSPICIESIYLIKCPKWIIQTAENEALDILNKVPISDISIAEGR